LQWINDVAERAQRKHEEMKVIDPPAPTIERFPSGAIIAPRYQPAIDAIPLSPHPERELRSIEDAVADVNLRVYTWSGKRKEPWLVPLSVAYRPPAGKAVVDVDAEIVNNIALQLESLAAKIPEAFVRVCGLPLGEKRFNEIGVGLVCPSVVEACEVARVLVSMWDLHRKTRLFRAAPKLDGIELGWSSRTPRHVMMIMDSNKISNNQPLLFRLLFRR
jgi:hypothetical protein